MSRSCRETTKGDKFKKRESKPESIPQRGEASLIYDSDKEIQEQDKDNVGQSNRGATSHIFLRHTVSRGNCKQEMTVFNSVSL